MSDYTKTTNFTAKDSLGTGDPDKLIVGALFDTEFDNAATASATKYDSGDLASQAQAQAGTSAVVLMTPLRAEEHVQNWAGENDAMVEDIQALNLSADALLGWDQSGTAAIGFTLGAGLEFSTTTVNVKDAIAGAGLTISSSILAVQADEGVKVESDNVRLVDVAAGAAQPVVISNGTFTFDLASVTELTASGITQSADKVVVSDAGTIKVMPWDALGVPIKAAETTGTLAVADMNSLMEFDGTATLTIPANAAVALQIGACVILVVDHATQVLTITADTGVTLNSVFHPGGASAGTDHLNAGGTAVLIKTATNEWYLSGDIYT